MSAPLSQSKHDILDRFDAAWNDPTPPRIEDFAPPADDPNYRPMMVELFKIDMERRFKRGEQPTPDDYCQRFPACSDVVAACLDEARAVAQRAAEKETDDPGIPPTMDGSPRPPTISPPLRIVGEYELLERIPGGGMGEVYKARHRHLNKLVALKLLPADSRYPGEAAARFRREMKAAGALDHPNIVEAYDAGEQSGEVYLAMKLIDGVDLDRLVKERGPLPIAEACDLVRQAALGLEYLHQRGLVHRDVKPSNLMRTPDGTVKVLDLGLARWCLDAEAGHGLTSLGRAMGTPDFLAPEQVENAADADARADLYGLGGTLFYLLTGRAPFAHHKSLYSKLEAHCHEPPPDVPELRKDAPAALAALVYRLLAKKPEERFATAAEAAAALAPFCGMRPAGTIAEGGTGGEATARCRGGKSNRGQALKLAIGLAVGKKSCSLTLAFGMALMVGLPACWLFFDWRRYVWRLVETTIEIPSDTKGPPIRLTLEVLHQPAPDRDLLPGKLGEKVFETRIGDRITVAARLSPPAHAFLIAFQPDGVVEGIFPDKKDQAPPQQREMSAEYVLDDGAGLEAFAAVVSSQPLPSFKEWRTRWGEPPWGKFEASRGLVWRADGFEDVQDFPDPNRSKPKGTTGRQAVKKLAEWLRQRPGIERVQVLGFAVEPKK